MYFDFTYNDPESFERKVWVSEILGFGLDNVFLLFNHVLIKYLFPFKIDI